MLFVFTMAVTTFTVVWLCQVAPKQLAVINSEAFLTMSLCAWRIIRAVSPLGLPDPATDVVAAITSHSRFKHRCQLRPRLNDDVQRVKGDAIELGGEAVPGTSFGLDVGCRGVSRPVVVPSVGGPAATSHRSNYYPVGGVDGPLQRHSVVSNRTAQLDLANTEFHVLWILSGHGEIVDDIQLRL